MTGLKDRWDAYKHIFVNIIRIQVMEDRKKGTRAENCLILT